MARLRKPPAFFRNHKSRLYYSDNRPISVNMESAPLHPQERLRIESLKAYSVLDTLPEQDIDDLTFLISQICDVPIALVSLVDSERQWFKSRVGLELEEMNRDIAFCSHAILQDEVFYVEDTTKDQRFFDNPLVTGSPFVRFYAGTPLIGREGLPIGTLCIIDNKPRNLTDSQIKALRAVGRQAIGQLELRRHIYESTQKNDELNVMNQRLEQLANIKTEFLNHVSHEIRTPLTGLLGLADILSREFPITDRTPEDALESRLHYMHSAAKNLADMVNHVLDISRLESGKMEFNGEVVFIESFINELVVINKHNSQKKKINIEVSVSPLAYQNVVIDKIKTAQILINLIGNAIKFSPYESTIAIDVSQNEQTLEIAVTDNGIGIPKDEQHKIFDAFMQVKKHKNYAAGSGLGLTISKQLADFLKGNLSFTSQEGRGTCFRLTLPFQPGSLNHSLSDDSIEELDFSGKKLLLVEDTKVNQLVFKAYVAPMNLSLEIADSAEAGLQKLIKIRPDVLILDVRLPDKSGFELCEEIRAMEEFSNLPIIFFSADVSQDSFTRAKLCGAVDFLPKPLERSRLLTLLKDLLCH